MLEIKSLTDGNGVLKEITCKLQNGGTYGVFARTREERTALFSCLSGDKIPDKGQVLVGGFDLWREPKNAKKSIGYLPYDDPTPDELSPAEYLLFIAEIKGIGRELAVRHVQELLYAAGLEIYRDAPLSSLSPYERRLTGLLQALLGEPEFLLLDDPAAHLSHEDTRRMLRTVKELGEKHTVLVGLRSLSDLLSICDRILVIDGGTTAGVFDPRDAALKEYETAFKRLTGGNNQ